MDRTLEVVDMWSVLHRHKRLFWSATTVVIGLAVLAAIFLPAKYESRAVLVIGRLSQLVRLDSSALSAVPLEPAGVLVQRLKHQYRVDDDHDHDHGHARPRLVSVSSDLRDAKEVVVLRARASTADQAQSFLSEVISTSIVGSHGSIYKAFVAEQNSRIALLAKDIAQLRAEIDRLKLSSRAMARIDAATSALVIIERAKLISAQSDLEARNATLQAGLLAPYSEPTRILLHPTLAERPSQPRPVLYISLALMVAPLVGALCVFIAEFASRRSLVARVN